MIGLGGFWKALGSLGRTAVRSIAQGVRSLPQTLARFRGAGVEISPAAAVREVAEARRVTLGPTSISDVGPSEYVPWDLHQQVSIEDPIVGPAQYTVHAYGRWAAGTAKGGQFMAWDVPVSVTGPMTRQEIEDVVNAKFGPEGDYPRMGQVYSTELVGAYVMEGTSPW